MTIWSPELAESTQPLYQAIADAIATDVARGRLSPGARLPTHRDLAGSLNVALTTVTRAYAEAERRGLISGQVGRGTFVRAETSVSERIRHHLDLSVNTLLPFPYLTNLSQRLADTATASDPLDIHDYQPLRGTASQRETGARWMKDGGLPVSSERVVVTSGAQHAMLVTFATISQPGDTVLTESLTYGGMRALANLLNLRVQGVQTDDEGIDPAAFERACTVTSAKVLFSMPTLQNPTSTVMSIERRQSIAAIAAEHGVTVVEDDSYGFLIPNLAPLSAFAERAFYIKGTSKSLVPGLRVAFLAAPPDTVDRLAGAICSTTFTAPPLGARVVESWIEDGWAEQIMSWKREEARSRQRLAIDHLAGLGYTADPRGHHGWLTLPEPWCARDFVAQSRARGVLVSPADDFIAGRGMMPHAVRVCLGTVPNRADLTHALATLQELLTDPPDPRASVV